MQEASIERPSRPPRAGGSPLVRLIALCLVCAAIAVAVLALRGWRPGSSPAASDPSPVAAGMPSSARIEEQYGIRFTSAALTSGNGMIQLRYQVLDPEKALALHEDATSPVIVRSDGALFAAPGIPGHSHSKNTPDTGRAGYTLLANTKTGIHRGMIVTVRIGDVELHDVQIQ